MSNPLVWCVYRDYLLITWTLLSNRLFTYLLFLLSLLRSLMGVCWTGVSLFIIALRHGHMTFGIYSCDRSFLSSSVLATSLTEDVSVSRHTLDYYY